MGVVETTSSDEVGSEPGDRGLRSGALGLLSISGALLGSVVLQLVQRSTVPLPIVPTRED